MHYHCVQSRLVLGVALLISAGVAYGEVELAIRLLPQRPVARIGQTCFVDCVVSWEGDATKYAVLAAEPVENDPPGWQGARVVSVFARQTGEHFEVVQTLAAEPLEPGEFTFPEFSLKVAAAGEEALTPGLLNTESAIALRPEPLTVTVRPEPLVWPYLSGAAFGFCLAGGVAIWWWLRRRRAAGSAPQESPLASAQAMFHEARRHRLDGRYYECYQVLTRLAERLSDAPGAAELTERMRTRARDAGYRGMRPNEDQLEGDFRDVERLIRHREEEETS